MNGEVKICGSSITLQLLLYFFTAYIQNLQFGPDIVNNTWFPCVIKKLCKEFVFAVFPLFPLFILIMCIIFTLALAKTEEVLAQERQLFIGVGLQILSWS